MYPQHQNRRSMGLTRRQEAFAVAYCRRMNASAAYREAYAPRRMSAKTINEAACRLKKNSKVAARIEEITGPAAEAASLDKGAVLKMLLDTRARAMAAGQIGAAIRAIELLGKAIGVFNKRVTVSGDRDNSVSEIHRVIIVPAKGSVDAPMDVTPPELRRRK